MPHLRVDENATCSKVLHKKDDGMNKIDGVTKDLNGIVGMNEIAEVRLGDGKSYRNSSVVYGEGG